MNEEIGIDELRFLAYTTGDDRSEELEELKDWLYKESRSDNADFVKKVLSKIEDIETGRVTK